MYKKNLTLLFLFYPGKKVSLFYTGMSEQLSALDIFGNRRVDQYYSVLLRIPYIIALSTMALAGFQVYNFMWALYSW